MPEANAHALPRTGVPDPALASEAFTRRAAIDFFAFNARDVKVGEA